MEGLPSAKANYRPGQCLLEGRKMINHHYIGVVLRSSTRFHQHPADVLVNPGSIRHWQ